VARFVVIVMSAPAANAGNGGGGAKKAVHVKVSEVLCELPDCNPMTV
jgi:hypothetical protein